MLVSACDARRGRNELWPLHLTYIINIYNQSVHVISLSTLALSYVSQVTSRSPTRLLPAH